MWRSRLASWHDSNVPYSVSLERPEREPCRRKHIVCTTAQRQFFKPSHCPVFVNHLLLVLTLFFSFCKQPKIGWWKVWEQGQCLLLTFNNWHKTQKVQPCPNHTQISFCSRGENTALLWEWWEWPGNEITVWKRSKQKAIKLLHHNFCWGAPRLVHVYLPQISHIYTIHPALQSIQFTSRTEPTSFQCSWTSQHVV